MKTIFVESEFDEEVVNQIISEVDDYVYNQGDSDGVVVRLYIESEGGHLKEVVKLAHYINHLLPDNVVIEMYANHYIQSSALLLFLMVDCYTEVLPTTWGMIHEASRSLDVKHQSRARTYENFLKSELDFINSRVFKLIEKCGVSPEKIDHIKDGYDVFFNTEELIEIIEKSKGIDGYEFFY